MMRVAHTDLLGNPIEPWREVYQATSATDSEAVPRGSIEEVLAWVQYDPDRAKAAITAELSWDHTVQRERLIDELQARLKEG